MVKKTSLFLSALFSTLMFILYLFGTSFFEFLFASLFLGLWQAFSSGTRESMVFDTLKKLKRESEYKKVYGRLITYAHTTSAAVLLVIPVLYQINVNIPFLIGISFSCGMIITSIFMIEPQIVKKQKTTKRIINSFYEIIKNKKAVFLIVIIMIFMGTISSANEFNQPLLIQSGLDIIYFGIIYSLIRVFSGLGAELSHRLDKKLSKGKIVLFSLLIIPVCFFLYFTNISFLIILGIILLGFGLGIGRISVFDLLQNLINSENRTTILSISSLFQFIFKAFFVVLMGITADTFGLTQMFGFGIIIFATIVIISFIIFRNQSDIILT